MKPFKSFPSLAGLVTALGVASGVQLNAVPVDVELSLLIDVSGSVSASEFTLQRDGYKTAFQDPSLQAAINAGSIGAIAVNVVYWSSSGSQSQAVPFTLVDDGTSGMSAFDFGALVGGTSRPFGGNTAPGSALAFATPLFSNGFEGANLVIDMSGDGAENNGIDTAGARDAALAAGVDRINGLVISSSSSVLSFYNSEVKGGTDAFVIQVDSFDDFAPAILTKLKREVTNVSTPDSGRALWLAMLCVPALFFARRQEAVAR